MDKIARRYYGQAQADRTDKGTGPQAEKAREEPEAPGEGAEDRSQREEIGGSVKGGTAPDSEHGTAFLFFFRYELR